MHGIIVKLLNCFIVTSPSPRLSSRRARQASPDCAPSFLRRGIKGEINNLAIEQFNNRSPRGFTRYRLVPGFTLVELLIVIAVLGILATGILTVLNVSGTLDKATIAKAKVFSKSIESDRASQVGMWSFEEQTDTVAQDSSSFSNDGTLSSSAMWRNKDQCGLGFGWCLQFNGTSDYVEYTGFADFTATSPKTISVWFKLNADGIGSGSSQPVVTAPYFRIYVRNAGNEVRARTDDAGAAREAPMKTLGQGDRNWHHAVGVFSWNGVDTQTLTLYVDGTLVGSNNHTALPISAYNKYIGRASSSYFTGYIDEVSIYNQALTAYQVKNLYAQGVITRAIAYK